MKNSRLFTLSLGITALFSQAALAQSLFTTANDFAGWAAGDASFTAASSTGVDLDGSAVNGVGNTSAAGSAGTAGSLSLQWVSGTYDFAAYSPGEQGNAAFLTALENASTLTFDFTTPPAGTGNYFGLGIVLNYQNGFDQLFPASTSSLGGGISQATVNWSSEAATLISKQASNGGSFGYFQFGVIFNSNYTPTGTPFNMDNFQVTPAPEPGTLALAGLGGASLFLFRRRHS
jgi:hypothetical protein